MVVEGSGRFRGGADGAVFGEDFVVGSSSNGDALFLPARVLADVRLGLAYAIGFFNSSLLSTSRLFSLLGLSITTSTSPSP